MKRILVVALLWVFFSASSAQAIMFVRGTGTITSGGGGDYQLIYDDVLDITWLDYTRSANNWNVQNTWADDLVVSYDGLDLTGWRLPEVLPVNGSSYNYAWRSDDSSDIGFNISAPGSAYPESTGSEMANLFYGSLGNYGAYDIYGRATPSWESQNTGYFDNLEAGRYWSGTISSNSNAFWFEFGTGAQDRFMNNATTSYRTLAVLDGDVPEVAPVPEPATILLVSAGLAGIAGARRKMKKK